MSTADLKLFTDGRDMYRAFQRMHNPTKVYPTQEDIRKLARQLDLQVSYVSKRVWMFLEN